MADGARIRQQDMNGIHTAVINQTFEKRFFVAPIPSESMFATTYPGNPADMEVVGVVADAKLQQPARRNLFRESMFRFLTPCGTKTLRVYEVRTYADPAAVSAALRQAVQETSASLPPITIHTMSGLVDESLQTDRFIERLSGAFGVLALALASIGLYGIMAYTVARRTRDTASGWHWALNREMFLRQVLVETSLSS